MGPKVTLESPFENLYPARVRDLYVHIRKKRKKKQPFLAAHSLMYAPWTSEKVLPDVKTLTTTHRALTYMAHSLRYFTTRIWHIYIHMRVYAYTCTYVYIYAHMVYIYVYIHAHVVYI